MAHFLRQADSRWPLDRFCAAVLDLDGVITRTAALHAEAWQQLFNEFLATCDRGDTEAFDTERDYRHYIDGKPRLDGVRAFLASRNIALPEGEAQDSADVATVHGLGKRKNQLFRQLLEQRGVQVFGPALELVRQLHRAGLRTAVVSSSRNCQLVLEAADIAKLFAVRVDGNDLQQHRLQGKPAPDMFLEACRRLQVKARRCIGFEDAEAGVQALRAADYGLVVGVARNGNAERLRAAGADVVIENLQQLQVSVAEKRRASLLPCALDSMDRIVPDKNAGLALFLDYDGTLTPIVDNPDAARLSTKMRKVLQRLAHRGTCAVISGRDLPDVQQRVGIAGIWYAGSHGFDIAGPNGQRHQYEDAGRYLQALDEATATLQEKIGAVPGCLIERKRFAIAVHYRRVQAERVHSLQQAIETVAAAHPGLRLSAGKKIRELQPAVDWNKGKALIWLSDKLGLDFERFQHIYLGDDTTDEDAFRALHGRGVGIRVTAANEPTAADYRLHDPAQVEHFLQQLAETLEMREA